MLAERKQLASVRKLLSQNDAGAVRQGLELASSMNDPELWVALADGVSVDDRNLLTIPEGCEVHKRVKSEFREEVALWALRSSGRLDGVTALRTGGSIPDFTALSGLESLRELRIGGSRLTSFAGMEGLPGLRTLATRARRCSPASRGSSAPRPSRNCASKRAHGTSCLWLRSRESRPSRRSVA